MGWVVKVKWQGGGGSCCTFLRLDKKTYHTKFSLKVLICKRNNEKGGFMMWMLFIMDGNKQKGKYFVIECNALKWIKANNGLLKGSLWLVPMANGMIVTSIMVTMTIEHGNIQMHRMHEQRGCVVWCFHLLHKVLEIWPLLTSNIWKHSPCPLRE